MYHQKTSDFSKQVSKHNKTELNNLIALFPLFQLHCAIVTMRSFYISFSSTIHLVQFPVRKCLKKKITLAFNLRNKLNEIQHKITTTTRERKITIDFFPQKWNSKPFLKKLISMREHRSQILSANGLWTFFYKMWLNIKNSFLNEKQFVFVCVGEWQFVRPIAEQHFDVIRDVFTFLFTSYKL